MAQNHFFLSEAMYSYWSYRVRSSNDNQYFLLLLLLVALCLVLLSTLLLALYGMDGLPQLTSASTMKLMIEVCSPVEEELTEVEL
jgi:hypothetical protein